MTDPVAEALRSIEQRLAGIEQTLAALVEQNGQHRRWLPLREAAIELGISYDAARLRAKRGHLNTRRQGERIYVDMNHPFRGGD